MFFGALLAVTIAAAPPADSELTDFGKAIAADLSAGKDGISSRVDFGRLVDRALVGITAPEGFRGGFIKGLKQGFASSWGAVAKEASTGSSITWRRNVKTDGLPAVQLRMLYKSGAFDFVELLVERSDDGVLKIIDLYDLADGSLRTADMRMLAIPVIGDLKAGTVEKLLGSESKLSQHVSALRTMNEAVNKGDFASVRTTWKALPVEVREHRLFFKPYISALSELDDPDYEKAMGRYLALYPDDPAAQVMGIDFYFLRKRWPQCNAAIDAVEKRVGDDGWFDVLRGSAAIQQGKAKLPEMKKFMARAIEKDPTLKEPYMNLIDAGLTEKKWADVSKWMLLAEKNLGLTFNVGVQGFEGFAASKEGKAYAKTHPPSAN